MKVECVLGQSKAVSMAMSPLRISNCVARGGVLCYRYHAWQLPHYPGVPAQANRPRPPHQASRAGLRRAGEFERPWPLCVR